MIDLFNASEMTLQILVIVAILLFSCILDSVGCGTSVWPSNKVKINAACQGKQQDGIRVSIAEV